MSHAPKNLRVLYLGDTALPGPASYLAGVMSAAAIGFEHRPSSATISTADLLRGFDAIVLSDFPAARFRDGAVELLVEMIDGGTGLAMIGGWASFSGLSGGYGRCALARVLPVLLEDGDDRQHAWGPCVVVPGAPHPITAGLPLEVDLPCVCGFNRLTAREGATVPLSVARFRAEKPVGSAIRFAPVEERALLVTGTFGAGRVACFASDVAPHWVGGLVDWGRDRIRARAAGGEVEIGDLYARLFTRIIRWVCSGSPPLCERP